MSLIEIRHLRKEYPEATPLEDVSVNIEQGEVVSIIGPSGTGKSTLLRCINRLEQPTSGQILIDGVDVCDPSTDLSAVRRKMGMVFQSFNLFPHLMVAENIMQPQQKLLGRTAPEAYEEALRQLKLVGLEGRERRYPNELSGGQKQRVAIARALAMHPKIMLFDEPTSALDPAMVSEVISVMQDLAGTGLTMLVVTHEMRLARDLSSRVFFMDRGGIYEDGTSQQIFTAPRRERTRRFIYRVRSWEYTLTPDGTDMYEMLGSLSDFCSRQFMGRQAASDCELAVEELTTGYLQPALVKAAKNVAKDEVEAEDALAMEIPQNEAEAEDALALENPQNAAEAEDALALENPQNAEEAGDALVLENPQKLQVRVLVNAGEEGREMTVLVDESALPGGCALPEAEEPSEDALQGECASPEPEELGTKVVQTYKDALPEADDRTGQDNQAGEDDLSSAILHRLLHRLPDPRPGVVAYRIRSQS